MKFLRTLTEKSILGFGKYSDMRVGEVLKMSSGTNYLRWVYYNLSMINFCDLVLYELYIHTDLIIKKPGKNPDLYIEVFEKRIATSLNGHKGCCQHIIMKAKLRTRRKGNYMLFKSTDKIKFSKGNQAWKNQGH